MYDMILIRYGEMTLKKSNYKQFLRIINNNIREKIGDITGIRFTNNDYRAYIYLNGVDYKMVCERLDEVSGISSYSLCKQTSKQIEDIAKWGIKIINDLIENGKVSTPFTFKVETNRGDKSYPLTSPEITKQVAGMILPNIKDMSVDVHNPDLTLFIDLRSEGAYIFTETIKGMGGYPSGVGANALVMMSGGIDSPVSAYLAMKKGIKISAIHFAAPPYTSQMAVDKVKDLLSALKKYQAGAEVRLLIVPLTDIEVKIHKEADEDYMITLLRRSMYRIASIVAKRDNYMALVNGESVGQVASQTLESMMVVNDVTNIPILRPLAMMDKEEIISVARKIGTYDISIRPYEDCCTIFVPVHPVIRPSLAHAIFLESKLNLDELEKKAIESIEEVIIK